MIKLLSVGLNSGEGFKNLFELSGGTQKQSGGTTAGTAPITLLNQMPTGSSRRGPVLGKAAKGGAARGRGNMDLKEGPEHQAEAPQQPPEDASSSPHM